MMAAGRAIRMLTRNLSFISTPWVRVAAIVVSEMTERLSPNIDPPTTVPITRGMLSPVLPAISAAIGTSTVIVPTLVPMDIEIRQAMMKSPGTARFPGMMSSMRFAVLDAPPAALARPLNAPAIRKMNSIMTILSSPMPCAQRCIFSLKLSSRPCANATISARPNATTTEIT